MASVRVSMELVASSRIITGGSATAARAMAISWRWPCERFAPLLVSMRVVALRQARDEVVRAGELCRRDALLVRRVQTAVADVVHDRAR